MVAELSGQIGDFVIEGRLGAGGMGIVYKARQVSLNRPVALKVLGQARTDPRDIERFKREALAAAKLNHPGIATIHYIGQNEHICYLAMEYIEGLSLRQIINKLASTNNPETTIDSLLEASVLEETPQAIRFDDETNKLVNWTPKPEDISPVSPSDKFRQLITKETHIIRCCQIVSDIALALHHAHENGVIHRDLKPDNIMIDRNKAVHIIDFGLARLAEEGRLTSTGQLIGTPIYMSPEQVTGRIELDVRSDIYSLGLVLYELLTLQYAVLAQNVEQAIRTILAKPIPPVRWQNDKVSADLEAVTHKASEKDAELRYANALEFAEDIKSTLEGKPVSATPYRYRADTSELKAMRPASITVLAFFMWFVGVWHLISAVFVFTFILTGVHVNVPIFATYGEIWYGSAASAISAAFFIASYGLMAGWRWTKLICTLVLGFLWLYVCWLTWDFHFWVIRNRSEMQAFVLNITTLFFLMIALAMLHSATARRWFRDAKQYRKEMKSKQSVYFKS